MLKNKIFLIVFLLLTTLALSGCVSAKKTVDTSAIDGGVFKTANKGVAWQQKVLIPTISGRAANFSGVNVASLVMDPGDSQALYYGGVGNGLLFTYDGGNTWRKAKDFPQATIRDIAIDPGDKCTLYVTIGNKLQKSEDCCRTWSQVYIDNELTATINAIAIDHFDTNNIFIGISRGDIIKSANGGESWQTVNRIKDRIKRLVIDPTDSRIVYAITDKKGIFRSVDSGETWEDINTPLKVKELKLTLNIVDFVLIPDEPDNIYLATPNSFVKSTDKGESWEKIELIPPDNKAVVNAIAINPLETKEIYYVTNTTFNRSIDGGVNWTPSKLPTSRYATKLMIHPAEPNILYLGVFRQVK